VTSVSHRQDSPSTFRWRVAVDSLVKKRTQSVTGDRIAFRQLDNDVKVITTHISPVQKKRGCCYALYQSLGSHAFAPSCLAATLRLCCTHSSSLTRSVETHASPFYRDYCVRPTNSTLRVTSLRCGWR